MELIKFEYDDISSGYFPSESSPSEFGIWISLEDTIYEVVFKTKTLKSFNNLDEAIKFASEYYNKFK